MANRQQFSILKQGTSAWNDWRKKNPDVRPDLNEAILGGFNLSGADLLASFEEKVIKPAEEKVCELESQKQ